MIAQIVHRLEEVKQHQEEQLVDCRCLLAGFAGRFQSHLDKGFPVREDDLRDMIAKIEERLSIPLYPVHVK